MRNPSASEPERNCMKKLMKLNVLFASLLLPFGVHAFGENTGLRDEAYLKVPSEKACHELAEALTASGFSGVFRPGWEQKQICEASNEVTDQARGVWVYHFDARTDVLKKGRITAYVPTSP